MNEDSDSDVIEVMNMARQGARTIPLGMIQDREVSEQGSEKRITRYEMLTESKLETKEVQNPRKQFSGCSTSTSSWRGWPSLRVPW